MRGPLLRYGPLLLLVAVAAGAWGSGLLHSLTPAGFAAREAEVLRLTATYPLAGLALYVAIYAVLTAACLPVALLLTVLGGYLFGTWPATAALVIAAALSSLFTYAAARSAFAPSLAGHLASHRKTAEIVERITQETFFYVLSLRFIPVVPFGAVNAAAGIARAPLGPFLAGTVLGGSPACLIYAGLGAGLRKTLGAGHFDPRHIRLSPSLIWPLVALAVLALLAAWLHSRQRKAA